jgi:hypothetical protein
VSLCVLAVERTIVAEQLSFTSVPPAERRRSCLQFRGPVCLFLRGLLVMSVLLLEPDRATSCTGIQVGDRAARGN